ncbi:MAG: UxaA family hydrolase [Lachnospirales bacterium]
MDLDTYTWLGYKRKNGKKGIRNKIIVINTVKCSEVVARDVVNRFNSNNIELIGFDGCTDNQYAVNMLISLIKHPNVGGVLAIGLGCEYIQPEWLYEIALKEGKEANWLFIQNEGGTKKSILLGEKYVNEMLIKLEKIPKIEMSMKDLIIGAECGGSDFTSGLAGNVVVGHLYDRLVDFGGTAIFEEIVEAIGLDSLLVSRGSSEKVKQELQYTYDKALDYCRGVNQYSVSPGNFAGGLSTIEEKSMGALIKSGTKAIEGVLKVSSTPTSNGLWLLDSTPDPYFMQFGITNPNDNEGLMALISCGAHIVFLVTGRGNVVGSAISPCIKITGNHNTFINMIDDMDFDASKVLSGASSQNEMTDELLSLTYEVARGNLTKAEELGHREYFIPYKYQDKEVDLKKNCT